MRTIKRWEVTYCGKPFLLYADSPDKIKEDWSSCMDEGSDIKPWTNTRHIDLNGKARNPTGFRQWAVHRYE